MKKCPKCNTAIFPNATTCPCGWRAKQERPVVISHNCVWTDGRRTCPMLGSMTDSINGSDRWYCRYHYHASREVGMQVLDDIEQNGIPVERDWKEDLLRQRAKELGLTKGNLTTDEYIAKCRRIYRQEAAKLTRRLKADQQENRTMAYLENVAKLVTDGYSEGEAERMARENTR